MWSAIEDVTKPQRGKGATARGGVASRYSPEPVVIVQILIRW
jgi:hypothetical protein